MKRTILLAVAAILATGCGKDAPPPRSAPLAQDLATWVAESDPVTMGPRAAPNPGPAEPAQSPRRLAAISSRIADDGPEARYSTRRIAPPPEVIPRPKRRGRVDLSFQGADMINAFQFLADAGRFNLVMAEGLSGKVSATLRGVDPYDALVSLAEANGAVVRYDRGIVVVSKR